MHDIMCPKLHVVCVAKIKEKDSMATIVKQAKDQKVKSKFNDEFEDYLKSQCLKTTFNGVELETFSWYKKVLGLA